MTTRTNDHGSGLPGVSVAELPAFPAEGSALLDVREDREWQAGHAPDAVHIPMGDVPQRLDEVPEAEQLYVVCRSGGRSARVAAYLNANGWDAINVEGGMHDWSAAGRSLVSGDPDTEPYVL